MQSAAPSLIVQKATRPATPTEILRKSPLHLDQFLDTLRAFKSPHQLDSYQLQSLGFGAFSAGVFPVYSTRHGKMVALKVSPASRQSLLEREHFITSRLEHPNVRPVLECLDAGPVFSCMVAEYVLGKDLFELLMAPYDFTDEHSSSSPVFKRSKRKRERQILVRKRRIARGILKGLEFLHGRNIVHNDIKPENILIGASRLCEITSDTPVKICDFGLSFVHRFEEAMFGGSPDFCCFEKLAHSTQLDFATDIFAFGLLFYGIITTTMAIHTTPENISSGTIAHQLIGARKRVTGEIHTEFRFVELKEVFLTATIPASSNRPTATKLLKKSFFKHKKLTLTTGTL